MPEDRRAGRPGAAPTIEGRLEGWLRPFLGDPILWPVLAVVVGVISTNLVPVLVLSIRDRWPPALAALALLAVAGVRGAIAAFRRRRLGPLGGVALAVAAVCVAETAVYLLVIVR